MVQRQQAFLAVDIGGTKVTVATFSRVEGVLCKVREQRFLSKDYDSLLAVLAVYAQGETAAIPVKTTALVAGVAGPVVNGSAKITNLAWNLDERKLAQAMGIKVKLVNDLAAHGYGLSTLTSSRIVSLQHGARPALASGFNAALIAAGTGLGEALLFATGDQHQPCATEGGHSDFGPSRREDVALLSYLLQRYEHVSWERVVSGLDGFRNLYLYLRDQAKIRKIPACETKLHKDNRADLGEIIVGAAAAGDRAAATIVEWFCRLYGAEAGNLALKSLAHAGVFVVGSLACRLLPWLRSGLFMDGFLAKGRFRDLLAGMPVQIVLDPDLPLRGAATLAETL